MYKIVFLLAIFLGILTAWVPAGAQYAGSAAYPPVGRWDDSNQRFLYHRVLVDATPSALYATDAQGRQILTIDILKDFPGAHGGTVAIENIAGGPDGSIVLFCILDYGVRPLKELILIYGPSGALRTTVDTAPYEVAALTVDEQGNIYTFAASTDMDPDDPHAVYPTVTKYDAAGHIVRTMLPSSNFAAGDDPTDYSDKNGAPLLHVTPKGVVVFSAASGKWFLLSPQGEILAQRDLTPLNQKIAKRYGYGRASVGRSFLDQNGALVLQMRLDDGPFDEHNVPPPEKMRFLDPLVKVDPLSLAVTEIKGDVQNDLGQFTGLDKDGIPVYAPPQPNGTVRGARSSTFKME